MKLASKSKNRISILDMIRDGVLSENTFNNLSEVEIKDKIYPILLNKLAKWISKRKGYPGSLAVHKAKTILSRRDDSNTIVNSFNFMGTLNQPSIVLELEGIKVAIEFTVGISAASLRQAIGKSMMYSSSYDFILYFYIDSSEDKRISASIDNTIEQNFLNNIWNNFNIRFNFI